MTFSHEDQSPQVNTRMSRGLKTQLEEFADKHGVPRSEVVREAVRDHLPDKGNAGPHDPEQRETWRWLHARTNEQGRVPAKDAINDLAQQHSMDRGWVKHAKLRPLERDGWITPAHRWIIVHEPDSDEPADE